MRRLNADEQLLWSRVTATIRPLSRDPVKQASPEVVANPPVEPSVPVAVKTRASVRPQVAAPAPPKPGTTLDGSWDRKLGGGQVEPDRIIDLHGHNLDRAWRAIDDGLERAIQSGERIVLLITGHQRQGEPPIERGKIRAAVHDWLSASRHSGRIAAVRGAHRRHGGGGSLYVVLRRR